MKRVLFLDFEDSFTFNVVQELTQLELSVEVIHWKDFLPESDHDLLVLGPGPGHPDDYQVIFPQLGEWMSANKKIFAICLGHQILWRMKGSEVRRSIHPVHGQNVELTLPSEWQQWLHLPENIRVQRYNSLAVIPGVEWSGVTSMVFDGEVMISRSTRLISYQFHPESMGTKCRGAFFRPILRDLL